MRPRNWEGVWLAGQPGCLCSRRISFFCVDIGGLFPHLGASRPFFIKANSLKVWLRQILRALPAVVLHYSNNLQPVSSLVKREVIPLLIFALRVLCIGSAFVCGRAAGPRGQLSLFPVRVQAIELCSHPHIVNFIFSSTILLLTLCSAPGLCLACAGEFTWSSWT